LARTGQDESSQANKINQQEKEQAYATGQKAVGEAQGNLTKLMTTGRVGTNPWTNPDYLANENKLQSEAVDQNYNSAKAAINRANTSTGGLNGSVAALTTRDLGLQSARLADQLTAERAATDYDKNVGYQQNLATMPLGIASAESPYFGTATTGQDSALGNLTQFGLASYGPWMAAIQAAGGAASAAIPMCPARGSLILMADGSEKPVEQVREGDHIRGFEDGPLTVTHVESVEVPLLRLTTSDGCSVTCSTSHTLIGAGKPFVVAFESLGQKVQTKHGHGHVSSLELCGTGAVFDLQTDGKHSYRADGLWALGVGDIPSDLYLKRADVTKRLAEFEEVNSALEVL